MDDKIVFGEPAQVRTRPLGYAEPVAKWLSNSTTPEAADGRRMVNDWFAELAPLIRPRFLNRLRSDRDTDFYQALDELQVHHLLISSRLAVSYEEGIGAPDFVVMKEGERVAAIEVVSVFLEEEWSKKEAEYGRLVDYLNTTFKPPYTHFVAIQPFRLDRAPRSPSGLAAFIASTIDEIVRSGRRLATGRAKAAEFVYGDEGGQVSFSIFEMSPTNGYRLDPDARTVLLPVQGGFSKIASRLSRKLTEKRGSRYEVETLPYLIAVGMHDWAYSHDDLLAATMHGLESRPPFFGSGDAPRNTRTSAVAVLRGGVTGPLELTQVRNPDPTFEWPAYILPSTSHDPNELGGTV